MAGEIFALRRAGCTITRKLSLVSSVLASPRGGSESVSGRFAVNGALNFPPILREARPGRHLIGVARRRLTARRKNAKRPNGSRREKCCRDLFKLAFGQSLIICQARGWLIPGVKSERDRTAKRFHGTTNRANS
jgi:hypothetical protein